MTIHVGLTGGGNISRTHARAVAGAAGAKLAAVYGTSSDKVRTLAAEFGAIPYTDFDAFLSHRPMDMVVLGSPSGVHASEGIAAAERGLHVLTEKPIDISLPKADELIASAAKAGVKLGVFLQDRLKPGILRLKNLLDTGKTGKPILAEARVKWYRPPEYYSGSRWRGTLELDGGGALINQGIHTIDLLLYLFGEVSAVQARMATSLHKIESEDTLLGILEFRNGMLASYLATTSAYPGYPRGLEVTGSEGTLILEGDRIVAAHLKGDKQDDIVEPNSGPNISSFSPTVADATPHRAILEDFIRAIQTDGRPVCDGREGRRSLAVVEAIYRSCRTGQRIQLS